MRFTWENYSIEHMETVEKMFDCEAVRFTGCDEGFKAFYDYWAKELGEENFWCKTVFLKGKLIAVIALAKSPDETFTIQELVLSPDCRGMGYGSNIISELLCYPLDIIGQEIHSAKAVVFQDNFASIRVFEKIGFVCSKGDNDVLVFEYR